MTSLSALSTRNVYFDRDMLAVAKLRRGADAPNALLTLPPPVQDALRPSWANDFDLAATLTKLSSQLYYRVLDASVTPREVARCHEQLGPPP